MMMIVNKNDRMRNKSHPSLNLCEYSFPGSLELKLISKEPGFILRNFVHLIMISSIK
jgi:hypothetical protein